MSDYEVQIEGKYSLDQITLQISGEEAGASEFISSKIETGNNLVTFRELPAGTILKPLKVVKQGDPAPSGTKIVWSGEMVVKGTKIGVTAYRTE